MALIACRNTALGYGGHAVSDLSALASLPPLSRITCDQAMLPALQALGLSAELQAQ